MANKRLIVGITGASGAAYGVRLLDRFGIHSRRVTRWRGLES